jgi:hypothetical protein
MNMPNDENTNAPDPSVEIATANSITKELVVSKEVNKHVHQSLKDGANDCMKLK